MPFGVIFLGDDDEKPRARYQRREGNHHRYGSHIKSGGISEKNQNRTGYLGGIANRAGQAEI